MTIPNGPGGATPGPGSITGNDGSVPNQAQQTQDNVIDQKRGEIAENGWGGASGALFGGILGGFSGVLGAIFGSVNNNYVRDLAIIQDHSAQLTELRAAFDQLLLQGNAIVYTSNNTYTPAPGITSVDVILIGAGGGGGSGQWNFFGGDRQGGAGGGGGGEIHTTIPASLFPKSGANYAPVTITMGPGGAGGTAGNPGGGGANCSFGGWLTAGGGNGGARGTTLGAVGGAGGIGMIPGGRGGNGQATTGR